MIESRTTAIILLAVLLSGFAVSIMGDYGTGTLLILAGSAGYFIFNRGSGRNPRD